MTFKFKKDKPKKLWKKVGSKCKPKPSYLKNYEEPRWKHCGMASVCASLLLIASSVLMSCALFYQKDTRPKFWLHYSGAIFWLTSYVFMFFESRIYKKGQLYNSLWDKILTFFFAPCTAGYVIMMFVSISIISTTLWLPGMMDPVVAKKLLIFNFTFFVFVIGEAIFNYWNVSRPLPTRPVKNPAPPMAIIDFGLDKLVDNEHGEIIHRFK